MRSSPPSFRESRLRAPARRRARARRRAVSALAALVAAAGLLAASGCTTAAPRRADATAAAWNEAREAMRGGSFARAEERFLALAAGHPERPEGREALFLLGVLYLDPRNPAWDPEQAEDHLGTYLHLDGPQDHRAEALALFALSRRLVEPPGSESSPLDQTVAVEGASAAAENGRLQKQLAEKDREIARLREELERIRRTLSPP